MRRILIVSLIISGILLFAGLIHCPFPLKLFAFAALSGSAVLIAYSIRGNPILDAFGLVRIGPKILWWCIPAIVAGIGLGILTRHTFDLSALPAQARRFAFIAPLIGAVEELVFRGYIQGYLRPIGRIFSVSYAAAVHTCYKLLIILTLSMPLKFDFFFLILWTFLGGMLFGFLRDFSKSTYPPMIAHALFDILLYGGLSVAPAWVWS